MTFLVTLEKLVLFIYLLKNCSLRAKAMLDALLGVEALVQFSFSTMLRLHETGEFVLGVGLQTFH